MLNYQFSIDPENWPLITIGPPYQMLSDLALCNPDYTTEIIDSIKFVMEGKMQKYSFGGSDFCLIDVYDQDSKIFYDFGESEITVPTTDLLKLMVDWKDFLKI